MFFYEKVVKWCAIIEFIEKEYAGLAGANKLLSVENVNEMLQEIKGKLHSEADKSKRILSTLKGNLSRIDGNMPQGDPIS